jgi:hypothetical protein
VERANQVLQNNVSELRNVCESLEGRAEVLEFELELKVKLDGLLTG